MQLRFKENTTSCIDLFLLEKNILKPYSHYIQCDNFFCFLYSKISFLIILSFQLRKVHLQLQVLCLLISDM